MSIRLFLCAVLLAFAGSVSAQPAAPQQSSAPAKPAAQKLTPEQRQAIIKFRKAMVENAAAIVKLVDQGQEGQVWDNASDTMKKTTSRDNFVKHVSKQRKAMGKMEARRPLRLYPTMYPSTQSQVPPGRYFTVRFLTKFADAKQPMVEIVSYHYDTPSVLRVSGYTIVPPAPRASSAAKR